MRVLVAVPWREKCQSLRLFHSLVPPGREGDVHWFLPPGSGQPLLERRLFDLQPFRWRLLNSVAFRAGVYHTAQEIRANALVARSAAALRDTIDAIAPDVVWGLGHLQQVLILHDALRDADLPLHLTVHDEPVALMRRTSHWPHRQAGAVERTWPKLLARARSIDVVCDGMQRHLHERYGASSTVLAPCPRLPLSDEPPPTFDGRLRIGLSGSHPFTGSIQALLDGLHALVARGRLRGAQVCWVDGRAGDVRVPSGIELEATGFLEEAKAVELLRGCHLLYLPHSFEDRMAMARRTAFPSKLSMYLPAARPVLFHAPEDASAVLFARRTGTGSVWNSLDADGLAAALAPLLDGLADFAGLSARYRVLLDEEFNLPRNRQRLWDMLTGTAGPRHADMPRAEAPALDVACG